jgi:hypothetical protein
MVPNKTWQWQYWQRYGRAKLGVEFFLKNVDEWVIDGRDTVAVRRVAVAGWEWCRWKEEIRAVRMVPNMTWQWQYWPRYGRAKVRVDFFK